VVGSCCAPFTMVGLTPLCVVFALSSGCGLVCRRESVWWPAGSVGRRCAGRDALGVAGWKMNGSCRRRPKRLVVAGSARCWVLRRHPARAVGCVSRVVRVRLLGV